MFNFLLVQCQFVYLHVFLTKNLFSVVYCRVFLSLSCIVVYYPINYRVCSFVYWNTRYTPHDTRYTKISCIKSETLVPMANFNKVIKVLNIKICSEFAIDFSASAIDITHSIAKYHWVSCLDCASMESIRNSLQILYLNLYNFVKISHRHVIFKEQTIFNVLFTTI